jgi:hypothetical protein
MGHAAGLKLSNNNDVVPLLFKILFPSWFTGFAFAAIAIGALVPAAVMSIGAANLFTRNFWKAYVDPLVTAAGEAKVAKITSLAVKAGAAPGRFVSANLICARFAIARRLVDPANVSGPDFRPLYRLVPGARLARRMGGGFFGRHMARVGKRFQAAAYALFRLRQRHGLFWSAGARSEHSRCNSRQRGASVLSAR